MKKYFLTHKMILMVLSLLFISHLLCIIIGLIIGGFNNTPYNDELSVKILTVETEIKDNEILKTENEFLKKQIETLESEKEKLELENLQLNNTIKLYDYTEDELELLCKVARAEAGMSRNAQKNVIFVILNRVNDDAFPGTITEVIKQSGQFMAYENGSYNKFNLTKSMLDNAEAAILDYQPGVSAQGALYFAKGMTEGKEYLFTDEVGHKFCK